jgi:hypothetical protein
MFNLEAFRAGQCGLPFSSADELPDCCLTCVYLLYEEHTVCFCEAFYYYCGYSWPDKLTQVIPPCLETVP